MTEKWTETYENLSTDEQTTHGITFRIPALACYHDRCWIDRLLVNEVNHGRLDVGESIVADGVTFYLESASSSGTRISCTLIVSGGTEAEAEAFDMGKALLFGVALIALYIYFIKEK